MRPFVRNLLGHRGLLALMAGSASAADCEVTHWWTSGGEAAAVAEFAKAFDATARQQVGRRRHRRFRRHRPPDHHQPHHGRKPAVRDAVQPGQGRRRPDRRRPDAGSDRACHEGGLEEHRPPGLAARRLHEGRQGLLRAGQPALGAVDVDQPPRLRGRRPDAADELGRDGRRRAESSRKRASSRFRLRKAGRSTCC